MHTQTHHTLFPSHTKKKLCCHHLIIILAHLSICQLVKLEILEWENCRIRKDFEIFNKMKHNYIVTDRLYGAQCRFQQYFRYIAACFPGVLLTNTPHNILSMPLAAFPHNHCRNNGQR